MTKSSTIEDVSTTKPFLEVNGRSIFFDEDWDIGIGGGLWSTGLAMSKYFASHVSSIREDLQSLKHSCRTRNKIDGDGITAIELGSGNGLLSACFASVAEGLLSELAVTDMKDHLSLMEQTFILNQESLQWKKENVATARNANETTESDKIQATGYLLNSPMKLIIAEHNWGEFSSMAFGDNKKFDFIFGSDVAYKNTKPLLRTLVELSHENTLILIGSTIIDSKPQFFKDLVKAGFRYERLTDHLLEKNFQGSTFGIFAIQQQPKKETIHY